MHKERETDRQAEDVFLADHIQAQRKQMDYTYHHKTVLILNGLTHNPVISALDHHFNKAIKVMKVRIL